MAARPGQDPVTLRSAAHFAFFARMFERTLRGGMGALRLPPWGLPPALPADAPVIVLANHPSWWDGIAFLVLARRLFPDRPLYVPIEAQALARYPFMRRIGAFGIEVGSVRGAATFLRTAARVLETPAHMLWVNAPGRFADPRERPLPVAPGILRLPDLAPHAVVLPLALEYPFWGERAPEMLAAFGPPIAGAELAAMPREARRDRLAGAVEAVMDRLAAEAISRDPARFTVLVSGREGMGGIYGAWQRLRAGLRGERFDPRHLAVSGAGPSDARGATHTRSEPLPGIAPAGAAVADRASPLAPVPAPTPDRHAA